MNCPACATPIDPATAPVPPRGKLAVTLLKDWRIWAFAFGAMLLAGLLSGAVGLNPTAGTAGAGGAMGVFAALRMAKLRQCPKCSAVVSVTPPK